MKRSAKSRGGRRARPKSRKPSLHEKWRRALLKMSPAISSRSENEKEMALIYGTSTIPRMPTPAGPSKGAAYTVTQFVRGSDMTLPTGTGLVGALLRQSTNADVFVSYAFALADIPNVSSLSAAFDQYRIEEIQFYARTKNNAVSIFSMASPNNAAPDPIWVIDRDDNTAPSTLLELQQYDNCQQHAAHESICFVFTPSITPSVFSGGAFSGYGVQDSGKLWLDVANTGIPHYGLKVGVPALPTSTTLHFDWEISAVYKVSFQNAR